MSLALCAGSVHGATVYRVGAPFTTSEKDSLERLGLDFVQIAWSQSQLHSSLDLAALAAGSLQPSQFGREENMAATALSREGVIRIFLFASENTTVGQVLIDGDPTTGYTWDAVDPDQFANNSAGWGVKQPETITLDLGGAFLVREVRFRPLPERPDHYLEHFRIGISPVYRTQGRGSGTGAAIFPALVEVRENTEADVRVLLDTPTITRVVQLQIPRITPKELGVAELEVYGGGFVSPAAYESEVFELPDIASWGEIRWSGHRDPRASVDIRTRSGTDPQPEIFWESRAEQQDSVRFLQGGGDLSLAEYRRQYESLAEMRKPANPLDRVSIDTEHWSFWSNAYEYGASGTGIVSPGPNRYLQIRVDLTSTVEDGGQLDYIEFKASVPPAVRRLVGEIAPIETTVGEATQFTYYIRPTIRSGDSSFDGVQISTPSGVVSVDSLRIAGVGHDGFAASIQDDRKSFEVVLPRRLEPTDSGALVEVVFTAPVLREVGTLFAGQIFDTTRPQEVRQRILPGNAADEVEADVLSVRTALSRSLLVAPAVQPNPFTPNGDGINDEARVSYKLLRLTTAVPVSIEIFDLSGRLVKRVFDGDESLGEYEHTWYGTDAAGRLVPPGLYLCRIVADVQSKTETSTVLVAVAY